MTTRIPITANIVVQPYWEIAGSGLETGWRCPAVVAGVRLSHLAHGEPAALSIPLSISGAHPWFATLSFIGTKGVNITVGAANIVASMTVSTASAVHEAWLRPVFPASSATPRICNSP